MADAETSTHIAAVATTMATVADQDRAVEFFTEKLGFETRVDMPYGNGSRWIEVAPRGAATTIALTLPRAERRPGRWTGIALASDDIDADHAELRARGVDVDHAVIRMGKPVPPMFWLRDPDRNTYLIVQNL